MRNMNENNKKFVEEFKERTSNYKDYDIRMGTIQQKKEDIQNSLQEIHRFLNGKVMASATSSLRRTDIEMPQEPQDPSVTAVPRDSKEVITFNHKGIGTLRVPLSGSKSYGQTFSQEVNAEELLTIMTNPTLKNQLVTFLIQEKAMKILKHFNDVMSAETELKEIKDISEKYGTTKRYRYSNKSSISEDEIRYEFAEPQDIFDVNHEKDGEGYMPKLMPLKVTKLSLIDADSFRLHYEAPVNEGEEDTNHIVLETEKLKTPMIVMQMPNELDKALTEIDINISKDYDRVTALKNQVENKLAVYAMVSLLSDDK
jgi:hypothetical protein